MNPVQLAREDPPRLVRLFKQDESKSCCNPGDLLLIACQLLHLATTGIVVSRGCTRVTFEFEPRAAKFPAKAAAKKVAAKKSAA